AALDLRIIYIRRFDEPLKVCLDLISCFILEAQERQTCERKALEVLDEKLAQRGAATEVIHDGSIDAANWIFRERRCVHQCRGEVIEDELGHRFDLILGDLIAGLPLSLAVKVWSQLRVLNEKHEMVRGLSDSSLDQVEIR